MFRPFQTSVLCACLALCSWACSGDTLRDPNSAPRPGADAAPDEPGGSTGGGMSGGGGADFTPTKEPFRVDDTGQAQLDAAVIDRLKQGSDTCSSKVLYPYEDTIFPQGLLSPVVMWSGPSEASYVRVRYEGSDQVDFEAAAGASNPGQMRLKQAAWNEIARRSVGGRLEVTLNVLNAGNVSSCKLHWRIASGVMTGAVYYNTYNHPDLGGQGAVMRLTLGQPAPEIYASYAGAAAPLLGPCKSCHSVSFNGSTIVANTHDYLSKTFRTESHAITTATQPATMATLQNATFGALTPDGSRMLAMGNPQCTAGADTFPRASNNMPLVEGPDVARLIDTTNGKVLPAAGLRNDWYMWMPQFSPDGGHVVFNHAKPDGKGGTDRRELSMMRYDADSGAFSELRVLVSHLGPQPSLPYAPVAAFGGPLPTGMGGCKDGAVSGPPLPGTPGKTAPLNPGTCTGPCYPAWPFFTPDGNGVVFALISQPDFASALPGRDQPSKSELWYVDTRTLESVRLDNANRGLAPGDSLANYYPTVLPVQVGGYFWVFWTSMRDFGHVDQNAGATRKRIWVSALTPRSENASGARPPLVDPSAPAFYLEGQGQTGNVRAFAALNPCRATGSSCASGLDCCGGYCDVEGNSGAGRCVDEPPARCALINERCGTASDCCQPADDSDPNNDSEPARECLGGYCGFITVI